MVNKTKIGIIGTGRMGALHLSKFRQMPQVELVGIYEPNRERALEIAAQNQVATFASLEELCFLVDGLVIASPTPTHFPVAKFAMERGCHVLIEKPFCETFEEALQLQSLAGTTRLVCQIGFLERFRLESMMGSNPIPKSANLESHRLSAVVGREASVDVVSDLMIHDVDLVLSLCQELPKKVVAEGFSVVTDYLDFARARLEFPSGRIAQLTASRIAPRVTRTLQAVSKGSLYEFDFVANTKFSQTRHAGPQHFTEQVSFDALEAQAKNFVLSIQKQEQPKVEASEGAKVLLVVNEIRRAILDQESTFYNSSLIEVTAPLREN